MEHKNAMLRRKLMRKRFLGLTLSPLPFALSLVSAMLFALCPTAEAQQPKKVPRLGYLVTAGDPGNLGSPDKAFRQGLRDLGYVEGENILVEYRYLEGKRDRIPSVVAELVRLKVDVLFASTPPAIRAAKEATTTIPIVMVTFNDPVATGIVDSLARPGGNITGLTRLDRELSGKRLELLSEVVPKDVTRWSSHSGRHDIPGPCAKRVSGSSACAENTAATPKSTRSKA